MIILHPHKKTKLRAAIFDFDGTISTLRCGWESVMEPLMLEYLSTKETKEEIRELVKNYIDESTGIQTIHQMKWLNEKVKELKVVSDAPDDPWFYKEEYNRRLMIEVARRRDSVINKEVEAENYIIAGSNKFLEALKSQGIRLYAASGTDEIDVKKESAALGFDVFFEEIAGAKPMAEDCSKEAVIKKLIEDTGVAPSEILVVGDGKVEISLGREAGALTLGIASDEENRKGINPVKVNRLTAAGANAIVGDFIETDDILNWI